MLFPKKRNERVMEREKPNEHGEIKVDCGLKIAEQKKNRVCILGVTFYAECILVLQGG